MDWKTTLPPRPKIKCCFGFYDLVNHFIFEWTMFGVIFVNIILTIVELTVNDHMALLVLQYLNYFFCMAYIIEAILKIIGLRQYYFLSKFNIFDFIVLLVALVDIVVELSVPEDSTTRFSPSVFRVVRVLKILRVGRVLRLLKVILSAGFLSLPLSLSLSLLQLSSLSVLPSTLHFIIFQLALPLVIQLVDTVINRRLRFGYDIGKGFVVGEEELLQQFDKIVSMVPNKSLAQELRRRVETSRLDVIRSLGEFRRQLHADI